jgi:hypothetical protein
MSGVVGPNVDRNDDTEGLLMLGQESSVDVRAANRVLTDVESNCGSRLSPLRMRLRTASMVVAGSLYISANGTSVGFRADPRPHLS